MATVKTLHFPGIGLDYFVRDVKINCHLYMNVLAPFETVRQPIHLCDVVIDEFS
jgi:hypothetical protein